VSRKEGHQGRKEGRSGAIRDGRNKGNKGREARTYPKPSLPPASSAIRHTKMESARARMKREGRGSLCCVAFDAWGGEINAMLMALARGEDLWIDLVAPSNNNKLFQPIIRDMKQQT
jgi:hypothetical protein